MCSQPPRRSRCSPSPPPQPSEVAFRGTISRIDAAQAKRMTGVSWRPGCPVHLRDLRLLRLSHRRFDGKVATGRLIVHAGRRPRRRVACSGACTRRGFPIRRMVPVDAYGASDFRSIEADNTSAFNCRYVEGTTPLVRARVRPRDRPQPDREPVRVRRSDLTPGQRPVSRPQPAPPRNGVRGRRRRACVRRGRLGLGRPLVVRQGLPALLRERPLARRRSALPGVSDRGSWRGRRRLASMRYAQIAPPRIPPASGPTM